MLTAMTAVDNILAGNLDKETIWQVNTEMEYHEAKAEEKQTPVAPAPEEPVPPKTRSAAAGR